MPVRCDPADVQSRFLALTLCDVIKNEGERFVFPFKVGGLVVKIVHQDQPRARPIVKVHVPNCNLSGQCSEWNLNVRLSVPFLRDNAVLWDGDLRAG